MSLTVVKGLQSEIFVPITPPAVWAPVTKEIKDMSVALATAAGVHKKSQERFNLAGDFTWRKIENTTLHLYLEFCARGPYYDLMSFGKDCPEHIVAAVGALSTTPTPLAMHRPCLIDRPLRA